MFNLKKKVYHKYLNPFYLYFNNHEAYFTGKYCLAFFGTVEMNATSSRELKKKKNTHVAHTVLAVTFSLDLCVKVTLILTSLEHARHAYTNKQHAFNHWVITLQCLWLYLAPVFLLHAYPIPSVSDHLGEVINITENRSTPSNKFTSVSSETWLVKSKW